MSSAINYRRVKELNKQDAALKAMEKRNAERVEQFKKTGKWVY